MKRGKSLFIIILLFFFCNSLYSQLWKQYADSANMYTNQKNNDKALELYIKVREELKKDSTGTKTYADYTYYLGILFMNRAQYDTAEALFLEAKEIREKVLSKVYPDYAESCQDLGYLYFEVGQYEKAAAFYLETKQILESKSDKQSPNYGRVCSMLGNIYATVREYDKAETFQLAAKGVLAMIKDSMGYAKCCFNLANIYENMNQNEKAETLYLEGTQTIEKTVGKEHPYYTLFINSLAIFYEVNAQNEKAEALYLEALAIREKTSGKESADYAQTCDNLSVLYTDLGQYKKAETFCLLAKKIRDKILPKGLADYAGTCDNLARLYMYTGEFNKSEALYLEAKQVLEKEPGKGENPSYALACNNLAALYNTMGLFEKAEVLHLEAKQIREKNPGKESADYAQSCNNLGGVYNNMGQYEKAEPFYLEAKQLREKLFTKKSTAYASTCNSLAILYNRMKQYKKAEDLFLESKQIREEKLGTDHPDYASTCSSLAAFYEETGQYKKAETLYLEAKQIIERILGKEHADYIETCYYLANLYWAENEFEKAGKLYEETFKLQNLLIHKIFEFTNESEKQTYLHNMPGFENSYLSFVASGFSNYDQSLSYNLSLQRRNLILSSVEQLRQVVYKANDTILKNKYDAWIGSREQLAFWYAKPVAERPAYVKDLEEQSNTLEKELTRLSSAFRDQKERKEVNWQIIQQHLKPGEAAIEFAEFQFYNGRRFTDSIYYIALLLRKDRPEPQLIQLFEKKQLDTLFNFAINTTTEEKINGLYRNNESAAGNNMSAKSIYQLIWQPLEKNLKGVTKIYFASAGNLHGISFAALPVHNQQVLSDKYQLVQVSTTAFLAKPTSYTITSSDNIHLYGAIQYDADSASLKSAALVYPATMENAGSLPNDLDRGSGGWPLLPGTEKEIHGIEKLGNKKNFSITIFSGVNATEESFKWHSGKLSPVILHVATHGFFNPDPQKNKNDEFNLQFGGGKVFRQSDNPLLRCALLFAGANNKLKDKPVEGIEDGILTAYEVSNLYLPDTKLVVLSACETALGDIEGNEVYGLQRSFKIAGVQNLVMSLWKVPDAATAEFMQLFYKNLFSKQAISNAFYNAQQIMKNKYRAEPYKWAAWVLVR